MSAINNVSFRGETTVQTPAANYAKQQYAVTNFKAQAADSYEGPKKKKSHPGRAIVGTLAAAAGVIALMGYSHKAGWGNKIKNENLKNIINTATEKCHDWCHLAKEKGVTGWNAIVERFSRNRA